MRRPPPWQIASQGDNHPVSGHHVLCEWRAAERSRKRLNKSVLEVNLGKPWRPFQVCDRPARNRLQNQRTGNTIVKFDVHKFHCSRKDRSSRRSLGHKAPGRNGWEFLPVPSSSGGLVTVALSIRIQPSLHRLIVCSTPERLPPALNSTKTQHGRQQKLHSCHLDVNCRNLQSEGLLH